MYVYIDNNKLSVSFDKPNLFNIIKLDIPPGRPECYQYKNINLYVLHVPDGTYTSINGKHWEFINIPNIIVHNDIFIGHGDKLLYWTDDIIKPPNEWFKQSVPKGDLYIVGKSLFIVGDNIYHITLDDNLDDIDIPDSNLPNS